MDEPLATYPGTDFSSVAPDSYFMDIAAEGPVRRFAIREVDPIALVQCDSGMMAFGFGNHLLIIPPGAAARMVRISTFAQSTGVSVTLPSPSTRQQRQTEEG